MNNEIKKKKNSTGPQGAENQKLINFSGCSIKGVVIPNRFVSQPMESNDADKGGKVSEQAIARYIKLAQGQWGIVIVEAVSISQTSMGRKNGLIINKDNSGGFKKLVDEFKSINPDSLILFQITHSGQKSGNFSEKVAICPDAGKECRYLETDEIEDIRKAFVHGALLAEKAGADGIDFKMCHGYFGSEILRPANARKDKWGGSFENRTGFLRESIQEIKAKMNNKRFLLGSRISMFEAIKGGCGTAGPDKTDEDLSEMKELIKLMHDLGMDYVNVSAGIPGISSEVTRPVKQIEQFCNNHFRFTKTAKGLLKELNSDMKVIGSAYSALKENSFLHAADNIEKGSTDFAGYGRQSFADPLLPKKLRNNEKVNYCRACSGCTGCTELLINQLNDGCVIYNDYYKQIYKKFRKNHEKQ